MKTSIRIASLTAMLLLSLAAPSQRAAFEPGAVWNDTDGRPINAHGGGLLYDKGTWYWFGEYKHGLTRLVENLGWECYRVEAGGVSCYMSKDLYHWKFMGVALLSDPRDSTSDIHTSKVIERPKVIYNEKTKKYVMWLHIDSEDYSAARAGVAVSDRPEGPYTYLGSMRPNGQMSRDQTLFRDTDGKAYQICSSENNATMYINELTDDYLKPTGRFKRVFIGLSREAPAMVKHNGKYYLLTSGCTGWDPNPAAFGISDAVMGDYKIMENPCRGTDADKTYYAQSTYIASLPNGSYIALFDRWNKLNLEDSRYVWLPLHFEKETMIIDWKDSWNY